MKKNLFWLAGIAVMLAACENEMDDASAVSNEKQTVTFSVQGDFEKPNFEGMTRAGGLEADGKAMTDLWVLDYVGGALVQQVHQAADDADFGTPTLSLDYGSHHIYFICSRGTTPTLSTDAHNITWATTSDTFYKDYSMSVTSGSTTNKSVTLERVATKLGITIADEILEGTAYVEVIPETWYYGIDYVTGEPTAAQTSSPRVINIPSSKIGKTNTNINIFGLSSTTEWTTNVTVTACDANDNILGQTLITDAPFVANRATNYSGNLFSAGSGFALSLNADWSEEYSGSW